MRLEDNLNDLKRTSELLDMAAVSYDLITSLCGEFIGFGDYRSVYDYNLDDRFVIKIEPLNTCCNIIEHEIWEEVKGLQGDLAWVKNWFAPVKWISPNGRLLVMQKTKERNKKKPEKVPKFMWDVKDDNFGWIGNNYVCHDYGQFYSFVKYSKAMKKHKWWSD